MHPAPSVRSLVAAIAAFIIISAAPCRADEFTGRFAISPEDLKWTKTGGFDVPSLGDAGLITRAGAPALPGVQFNIALPTGAVIVDVRALDVETAALPGRFDVAPMTEPRTVGGGAPDDPFIKDMNVYGRDAFFPGVFAEQTAQWDLVGQEFATITLYPLQFNPVTKEAILARAITYSIVYEILPGAVRETYNLSETVREHTLARLKRMAVNPDAVTLPRGGGGGSRTLPPADLEYVVIAPEANRYDWDPLVEWMTAKGVPARCITLEQIYANYTTGTDPEKIRSFVIDAHSSWGTVYFLLGGDTSLVPFHVWDPAGNSIPNDTFYADYDDDWKVEVYVGRASVESRSEIARFIDKSLEYQKTPPPGFGNTYFFMGFDLDSATPGEKCKEYIKNKYLPSGVVLETEYDSETGSHKGDCIAYLNAGQNLINNIDHANWNILGAGCVWHGDLFYTGDFINLTNGDRKGLFYSMGCYSLAYDYEDNIGEIWTQQDGGAGVAFVGNSRYGWYAVGYSNLYSMRYDQSFFEALYATYRKVYHAGEALGESKNDFFPGDGTYQYIFQELTLVGDPGLPLWTEDPVALDVQHLPGITTGTQNFNVKVTCGGQDFEQALVCIRKEGEVYKRAYSAVDGMARFANINPTTSGWMTVTVTARNRLPYEGVCLVSGNGPDLHVDLEFDSLSYFFGTTANYTIDVYNFTATSQTFSLWTDVTLPGGTLWPPSGYFDGPEVITLPPYGSDRRSYSKFVWPFLTAGSYTVNAYVGPDPGVVHEDHERVDILPG